MPIRISKKYIFLFLAVDAVIAGVVILFIINSLRQDGEKVSTIPEECVSAFADGGGPYYESDQPFREKIAPDDNEGQRLLVSGKLYSRGCTNTVSNAVIDIWQANESGDYEDEWYRGQIRTDESGSFKFETIKPLGYGEGTGYRPPHLHFKIWIDGRLIVTSQMFFEDTRGKAGFNDAYIIDIKEENGVLVGNYNIVLP